MSELLKVENLTLIRGNQLLFENVAFSLNKGEALQIIGANGAGKSSLASVIAGDLSATGGTVKYNGAQHLNVSELSQILSILSQSIEIDFAITSQEFIQMGNMKKDIVEEVRRLKIEDLLHKKITELSQGQLQRVFLAQLLVQDPQLLILDEPFSAQDSENTQMLIRILKELKKSGKALIIINHLQVDLGDLVDKHLTLK